MGNRYDPEWARAKKLCRLNQETIEMAKQLGFSPKTLIANQPGPNEPWKAPVKDWVRSLHEKKFEKREGGSPGPDLKTKTKPERMGSPVSDEATVLEWDRMLEDLPLHLYPEGYQGPFQDFEESHSKPDREEIDEEDFMMLRRQKAFRMAAHYAARLFSGFPWVERVSLFGSVALPLTRQIPRFHQFRRHKIEIWHECKDVDVAVWISQPDQLQLLRKARSQAVALLQQDTANVVCVAHLQMDVFLLEAGSNQYLGNLCIYGECPKGKPECRVPQCGSHPFLQIFQDFHFQPQALDPGRSKLLFSREPDGRQVMVDFHWGLHGLSRSYYSKEDLEKIRQMPVSDEDIPF